MKSRVATIIFILMGFFYLIISRFSDSFSYQFYSFVLIFLSSIYFIGLKKIDFNQLPIKRVVLASATFSIILFLTPPNINMDTTAYILGPRTAFLGRLNPFTTSYDNFETDIYYRQFDGYLWAKYPYTYSPLFLYIGGIFLYLSNGIFWINVYLFKFLFLLTFLGSVYVLHKIIDNPRVIYLYSLNPIVLNELIRGSHIESLLIFLFMLGIYFFKKRRFYLSYLSFISASLIKIYFVLFIPLVFVSLFKVDKNKFKDFVLMSVLGIFIFIMVYLPFWDGANTFSRLVGLIPGYSNEIITYNFLIFAMTPLFLELTKNFFTGYGYASMVLLVVGVILYMTNIFNYLIKKTNLEVNFFNFIRSLSNTYLIFLFLLINWFFPHYTTVTIILFALLTINNAKKYENLILCITYYSSFYYLILG